MMICRLPGSYILTILFLLLCSGLYSQVENKKEFQEAIEDNSMFIEEAYNQEDRVVQHISNLMFTPGPGLNIYYAFTQEWPAFGLKHQLSYTLQLNSLDDGAYRGLGDIMLNYRYQLSYKESFVACSPRISLIIPSGDKQKGLGNGSWGMQANLPVSKRWTNHFINHFNAGATWLFNVKDEGINFNKPIVSYFAGLSAIWLVSENFNLMCEYLSNFSAIPEPGNKVSYSQSNIIAPAFRFAINLKKLQIVPGLSVPVMVSSHSHTETGLFLYLSFEHGY